MGLTGSSMGSGILRSRLKHRSDNMPTIALIGNPNVGKSTLFNALTGLKQHTGNWTGKTVENAEGFCVFHGKQYRIVDLPGTYSLSAHSIEEQIACDYIRSNQANIVVVLCDANALERTLLLALQVLRLTRRVAVGVNLIDEAEKSGIRIRTETIEQELGIPVVALCARSKKGLEQLFSAIERIQTKEPKFPAAAVSADSDPKADFERLEHLCSRCISMDPNRRMLDREASDRLLMKRWVSLPVMALFLILIFWITLVGANYPSQWLSNGLFALGKQLDRWFALWNAPDWLRGALLDGVYRTLAWVVSVMLPPMAIFFPLFTLLEDAGFLPRIAFALDHRFSCCQACGKQALTTCMGFGCNAAGVVGCRIIESKRERMIAILTNAMIPCNGRFPALISILSILMLMIGIKQVNGLITALLLSVVIVFAISVMFAASWLLGHTLLDGVSSSYVLEIPPYRRPQIGKVLVRSLLDRTFSILGRAAAIAAPCGLLLWLLANIRIGSESMLHVATAGLDPVARIFGLDGTILLSFLLGSPANEIVLPISYMIYQGNSVLLEPTGTEALFSLFLSHGWTLNTAVCFIVFTVLHWPCATTVWTIRKETKSAFYTILAIVLPTFFGLSICSLLTLVGRIIGLS